MSQSSEGTCVRSTVEEVVAISTPGDGAASGTPDDDVLATREQLAEMEEEIVVLRRRLQEAPKRVRTLEERLLETKGQLAQAVSQNEKLTYTLREAREHIANLREEVEKLTQPPSAYGTLIGVNDDGTVDVHSGGRKMRVSVHPELSAEDLVRGCEVVLNESLNVVLTRSGEVTGEVVIIKEVMDEHRALTTTRGREGREPPRKSMGYALVRPTSASLFWAPRLHTGTPHHLS